MNTRHLTRTEIIDSWYAGERPAHLSDCAECAASYDALNTQHASLMNQQPELSAAFLAEQRIAIERRIQNGQPKLGWWNRAALAGAAAALSAVFLLVPNKTNSTVPVSVTPPPMIAEAHNHPAMSDTEFFAEISGSIERAEPEAAAPIRALFKETQN